MRPLLPDTDESIVRRRGSRLRTWLVLTAALRGRMASDLTEQVFNEKQLFHDDVRGEDEDDELPGLLYSLNATSTAGPSGTSKELPPESFAAPARPVGDNPRDRRRKKAAERAQKIFFWLETKYEVLTEVCESFENWKEAASSTVDFDLLWCDTAIPADRFMKLKSYQKMNHFVGMSAITRKNNLGRNLLRMRKQYPKEFRFFPDTWILPTDLSDFKTQFGKNKTFIVKPDNGCQGKGIFLVKDVEKVPVDFSTTYVAQRYIHKPFLLDGFKFDLRLYVLVLGCDPLRIFLHKRGLVRLASEQYVEPSGKNIQQTMVHLTNYAVNKMNPNFEENTNPEDAQDGHKRSWEAVQAHMRKDGHDVELLVSEIEDLIIKTLLAVQPSLSHFYHSCQPDDIENGMCFEILGFDVMLDHKLQPWLLEVNHAPSFATESELDRMVKTEVLNDAMRLLNLDPEVRRTKKREAREKMEQRAMGVVKKPTMEERAAAEQEIARERTTWEDQRLGGFKRLYPSEEKEREYMAVHDAAINIWEMLMGGTSRRTVRLTQPIEDAVTRTESDAKTARTRLKNEKAEKGSDANAEGGPPKEKRTKEQVREVVERLMAGCSARPRANENARRRGDQAGAQDGAGEEQQAADAPLGGETEDEALRATQMLATKQAHREGVQVGDQIKVQTNLGWESVTVRAKRSNGKIDIQFKDGEYMRSVLPRILRDTTSQASKDSSSSQPPPGALPAAQAQQALDAASQPPLPAQALAALAAAQVADARSEDRSARELGRGSAHRATSTPPGQVGGTLISALGGSPEVLSQLCAPPRPRRPRSCHPTQIEPAAPTVPPQLVAPNSPAVRVGGRGLRRGPSVNSSMPHAVTSQEVNRVHEIRLRQQLQQLISVRPIVNRRP